MTGPTQLAVNTSVVIDEAARLESAGYHGDAVAFVERLLLRAFTAGFRPLEPPPTPRGPGARRESIDAAIQAAEDAVRAAKERRTATKETVK
jgi:hypothetical protein